LSLDDWLQAEAQIGSATHTTSGLSPRQARLLGALDALDGNDHPAMAELASGSDDIADILRAALGEACTTEWGHMLAARVQGDTPVPTPSFLKRIHDRPLAESARIALTDDGAELYANPLLAAVMPRANQVQLAARAARITGVVDPGAIARSMGGWWISQDPARWPQPTESLAPGDIGRWSRSHMPWTELHERELANSSDLDLDLGLLLSRVARDLRQGRLSGLGAPLRALIGLLAADHPQRSQLMNLERQVAFWDTSDRRVGPAIAYVWSKRDELTDDEKTVVAKDALDHAQPLLNRTSLMLALEWFLRHGDPRDIELRFRRYVAPAPRPFVADLVAGSDRAVWILALHDARKAPAQAVEALPSLSATQRDTVLTALTGALANPQIATAVRAMDLPLPDAPSSDLMEALRETIRVFQLGDAPSQKEWTRRLGRQLRTAGAVYALDLIAGLWQWSAPRAAELLAGPLRPVQQFAIRSAPIDDTLGSLQDPSPLAGWILATPDIPWTPTAQQAILQALEAPAPIQARLAGWLHAHEPVRPTSLQALVGSFQAHLSQAPGGQP